MLDLGAYDETEVDKPQHHSWRWLHAEIASVANDVLGVDASTKLRDGGPVTTRCGTRIVYGTVEALDSVIMDFRPDLIVAGELIEHTPDTLGWLSRVSAIAPGVRVLMTTPNATSIVNVCLAFLNRENCHPDHLQIYSYKTLLTLATRLALREISIRTYYYDPHLFYSRIPRLMSPLVFASDRLLLKPIQWLFPLTGFGLILEGVFGPQLA